MGNKILKKIRYLILIIVLAGFTNNLYSQCSPLSSDDTDVCDNTTLHAPDPWPNSGVWTTTGNANIVSPNNRNTVVDNLDFGPNTFIWTVSADNCSDSIVIYGIKIPVDAGPDQPDACSSTTLNGSNPSPGTGKWTCSSSQVVFDDPTSPTAKVSNLPQGDVMFVWTVSYKGCDNSDTMVVTNNTPTPVNAGADDEACSGDSIQLDATVPPANCHGKWTVLGGQGSFTNDTLYNTWVSGLDPNAINVFRWRVYNNYCENSDTVEITDNTVKLQNFTSSDTICTDVASISVTCPSSTTYDNGQWKVIASTGTITDPNNCNTTVTGLNFDANTFRYVATKGGCKDSVEVTVIAYPIVANAAADGPQVCSDSVNLYGNDPSAYGGVGTWANISGSASINNINSPTTYATGLSKNVTNVFTWTITKGSCKNSDTVYVDYNEPDDAVISNGDTGKTCNNAYVLNAVAPTVGSGYWTSSTSGVTYSPNANSANVTVDNLALGTNTFIWHVTNGTCPEKTDTIYVINQYPPNVDAGGPYAHTCDGSINLSASSPPSDGSGQWTAPSPATFSDPASNTAVVSNLPYGSTILTWTVTVDQCSASDTVTVYNDQADPAVAQSDFHVCSTSATISANPITNGTGLWTTNDPAITIDNPNNNVTNVHNLSNGGNTFYWTVSNGSCSTTDTLVVYNDSVSVANAGADQYICLDSTQLQGNTPTLGTGQWILASGGANIDNPNKAGTWVHNLSRGENIFTWKISQGACSSEDQVSIFNLSVDAQINQANPLTTCTDQAVIVGNNPSTQDIPTYNAWGVWSVLGGSATVTNISSYQTTVTGLPLDTTLLVWTMKNGVCEDKDTLTVVNNSPSQALAGNDTIVCDSSLSSLHANTPIRGVGHWYVLAGGANIIDPSSATSPVQNLDHFCGEVWTPDWWNTNPAPNIFEWVITYKGCTSRDTVRVINGLPTRANAGTDDTVCSNETNLDALDQGQCSMDHWWEAIPTTPRFYDPVDGTPDSTDFNAHVENLPGTSISPTTSSFVWHKTNTFGSLVCEVTDTVQITSLGYEEQLNAGNDDAVCDYNYKLSATPPDSLFTTSNDSVTGYWTLIHGDGDFDNSNQYNTWVRNMGYTTNIYRWTVVNHTRGCEMNDDVYITNALPSAAIAGHDTIVCEDQALLTANRPVRGTGVWSVIAGGATIVNPTCQTFSCNTYANNLGPGINSFLWTVTNTYTGPPGPNRTCKLYDTLNIDNRSILADAGDTIYICADTAQLSANQPSGTTGQWTIVGGSGTFASTGGNTSSLYNDVVSNLTRGKNTLTWTINNGTCSGSDNLIVWDNLPNPNPNAGADQTICADSTSLSSNTIDRNNVWYAGNGTDTLQWGYSSQKWTVWGSGTILNPTITTTRVKNIPAQTQTAFIWHAYYHFYDKFRNNYTQTCELTDTVKIYNNSVTAEAGSSPGIVCGVEGVGAKYQLGATQVTAPESGYWTPVFNPGPSTIVTPSAYNSWVINMGNGDHIYQWNVKATTNGVTCSASDTVVVKVRIPSTSTVALPDSFEVCSNQAPLQANVPTWGVGHWEDVYGGMGTITDPNSNNTNVTALWPGKSKWAWVIDNDGCKSSDTITVINNTVIADADDRVDPNIQNICVDTFALSATDPNIYNFAPPYASGYWTAVPATITFDNSTVYNTTVRNLSNSQSNILRWTITKGGCSDVSQLVINNNFFTIDADVSSTDNHMYTCTDSIQLAGEQPGSGTGLWNLFSGGGTVVQPTLYNSIVKNLNANDSYLEWTVTKNGCTAKDTVIVTNNQVTANAGTDQVVCYDTTSLAAFAPIAPATGQWTTLIGGGTVTKPSQYNSHVINMATDLNQFIWTVTKGACSAKDTVNVWNNAPDPAVVEADKEVCQPNTTLSVAVPPVNGKGVWTLLNGGGTILDSTAVNANVENLNPGLNTFLWTVTKGSCSSVDTLNVTNNHVVADAGPDDTVCSNSGHLYALDPSTFYPGLGTGVWTVQGGGGTVDNSTLNNTTVSNLGFGLNRFRWTVTEGNCSASDDALIYNNSVVAIANDTSACSFPITLTGNKPTGAHGLWKNIGGYGTVLNDTLYNSLYDGLDNGLTNTLRWIVYNSSCADSVDIHVTNNGFIVSAGPDQTICTDSTVLNADDASPGIGTWSVQSGAGTFSDIHDPHAKITGLGKGPNILLWTVDKNGCSNSATVTITNNTPSAAIITGPANTESCDGSVTLTANHPTPYYATNQYWQQISGSGMSGKPTTFTVNVTNLAPGNNTFVWKIENGTCSDADTIVIANDQVASEAGPNDTICSDNTYLNATDPKVIFPFQGSGHWTNLSGSQSWIVNSTLPNTQVINLPSGTSTFQWTVVKGGCNQSDIVQITNSSVKAIASDASECDGDIALNGNDPSGFGGTGLWSKISGTGTIVDSTLYNTHITGVQSGGSSTLQWRITNGICSDSVQIVVTNNGFVVNAGANDTICQDSTVLNAENPSPGVGEWRVISGAATFANKTSYQTSVTGLAQGENVLSWKITKNGCSDSAQVRIVNNSPSPAIITGPLNTETCDGTVSLTAKNPVFGAGHWEQILGSGMTGKPTTNPISLSGLSPNNNIFAWVVENGKCVNSDTITIVNDQVESNAGANDTVCTDYAQLHATDPSTTIYGGKGHWEDLSSGGETIDNSLDPQTYVRNLPNYSPVTLQWVVQKGSCSATSNVNILNYSVSAIAHNAIVCDSTGTLSANAYTNPPEIGYWSIGAPNTAQFIDDSTNNVCQVKNLSTGGNKFTWHVSNSHCADSVTVFLTNNSFTVNADANGDVVNVCSDTYTLSGDNPSPGSGYWTKVSGPGLVSNPSLYNSKVTNLGTTATILDWNVTKNGCSASDQVSIINNEVKATASKYLSTCDGTVTLDGNNPSPGTGMWKKVVPSSSGNIVNSSQYNTQITGIDKSSTVALYWIVYSNVGSCSDSTEIFVTNNDFDLSAGLNDTTCADTIQLAADDPSPGTGVWSVPSGAGVFDNSTDNQTIVRNIGKGDNVYSWTVTKNGCTETANVTITNNSVTANAGFDQLNLCTDVATLNGNDPSTFGGTGYWKLVTGGGNIVNPTNYTTTVNNLSRNDNTFRWTVSANGCSSYDDVVLRNNSFDVEAGLPQTVCSDTAQLKAVVVNGGIGKWSTQGGTPATIDNPSMNNSVVRDLQQGSNTFRWTVTRDGCTFYDDVVITNDLPNPPQLISSDDTICIDSAHLQAVAPEAGVTGTWTYTGSGGTIQNIHNNDTWAVNMNLGSTQFIWTVKHNNCELSDQFTVVNDMVTSNAGGDQKGLCQNFVSLNAVPVTAPATAWWTKADAQPGVIANSLDNVTNVSNLGYGQNKFVWNVKKGICSATDTVVIINNSASKAEIGNIPPTCTGSAILSATPPTYGTGVWSYTGTYPVNIQSPSSSNTQVTNLEYGANLFTWTVTNVTPYATCKDDTSFTVINNQFTITAGNDQILCDSVTHLEGETRPNADSAWWHVVTGSPSIADTTDPNSKIIIGQGQSTVLKWTVVENGCSDDDFVTIQNKGVTAIAYAQEVCDSSATLNAVPPSNGNIGYWTCSTPTVKYNPDNSQNNAKVTGLQKGANLFTWHLKNSYCSDSTTINVNYLVPFVDAGPSVAVCDDYHIMSASDPSADGGTGKWSVFSGAGHFVDSTAYNTTVDNLAKGTNIFRWTVTVRGCSNSDLVTITNNKPSISVGAPQNICQDFTTLSGNEPDPGDQGLWTSVTPGPQHIVDSTLYNSSVTNIQPGTAIFEWTVWNSSCTASEQLVVNNNSVTADAGTDIATCEDSVRLAASLPPNATGFWTSGAAGPVIQNSTLYNTWVTNLNQDNNLFTWTVQANGCSNSDFVIVTNNTVHVNAGDDQNICDNQTTLFGSNTNGGSGVWQRVSGAGNFLNSTANVTTVVNVGTGANVYRWTVTRGLCSGSDEVIINNNQVFADAGSGDGSLCDTKFELNAIPAKPGETGYWSVTGGAGLVDQSTAYHTWVRNLARGENILRWTVQSSACSNYDEITINNITPSQAVTAPDKEICDNYTVITANEPVYGVGNWVKVSGPSTITIDQSTANSTTVRNLGKGPNKFAWIITDTGSGCSTSDTIQVINSSTTAFAGLDKEICTDTFKLEASNPSSGYGRWTKVSSYGTFDNPTVNNTIVRDIGMGPNTYRWTVYDGKCSASDEVIITNNTPTVANAGNDQISCNGSATLIGSTPDLDETGLWSNISGNATFDDNTRYYTNVTNLSYGDNKFTWEITRGSCTSIDTVIVTNNKINVYAGEPQEVCSDSVILRGNIPTFGTGVWQLSGGSGNIQNSTNYQTLVTGLAPGVNTFKWVITEGACSDYDEVQITNNEPTDPYVCNDTVKICEDYTTMCANMPPDGEKGYWKLLSGSGIIENTTKPNTLVSDLSTFSSFTWNIQKGKCVKTDTVYIENGSVDARVSKDTIEVCGPSGTLSANNPLHGKGTWTLISGTGTVANSTAYITTVSGLNQGANTFRWTVVDGNCSASDDMTLVNNLYPATANMAGTNPICEPEVWVVGNSPSAGATGTWSFSAGIGQFDDIHSPATRAFNIGQGTNTARWTITKGSCSNYAEFNIDNETVYADANSPIIVCSSSDTAALTANDPSPGSGYWKLLSGSLNVINSTSYSTKVTGAGYGSNSLKWIVSNGYCSDSAYVVVQNNFFTVTAGADRIVCDTSTVLSGTNPGAGGTGLWSVAGGNGVFDNPTSYTTRVNGLLQGDNMFTWTVNKNGCQASDNVVITNGLPTAQAGGSRVTCTDSVTLAATKPSIGTGQWSLTGGSGNIVNPTLYNTVVRNLGHGQNSFRWTVKNGGCQAYDDIAIYNYTVTQTAGSDQNVCDTFTTLGADPPGSNGYGYWSVSGGSGHFIDKTLFNTVVNGLSDGVNTFTWTVVENGCSATDTVKITNNRFDADAGPDQIVSTSSTTLNAVKPAGDIGTWTVSGGSGSFVDNHDEGTDVNGLQYGLNKFTWTLYNPNTGCYASDDVDITYNGLTVDAGPSQNICADSTQLNAQDIKNATTYWTIDLGSCTFQDVTKYNTKIYNIAPGITILRWNVIKNGFSTSDTMQINNYMFSVDAGPDQYLCDNNTVMQGSGLLNTPWKNDWTGQWIISTGGGTFSNQNDPSATVTYLAPDTNAIRWVVTRNNYPGTGKCQASDEVNLIYYHLPTPDFAPLNNIDQGCGPLDVKFINNTSTRDTVPGTLFRWNFANQGEILVPHDSIVEHTFYNNSDTKDTTFTVTMIETVTVATGKVCSDTVQHNVTVWPVPKANIAASPVTSEYPNSFVNIENNSSKNGSTYSWDWGDGTGKVDHSYVSTYNHFYQSWGDYLITLKIWNSRNCFASDSQMIHVIAPVPTSGANNNTKDCAPLNIQLYGNVLYTTPGKSKYKWILQKDGFDDTIAVFTTRNPIYKFTDAGTYLAKLWATGEGSNPPWSYTYIRTDTIVIYPVPVADFDVNPKQVMAPNQPIHCYNYSKNAVKYFWDFGLPNHTAVSTEREPMFFYKKEGNYYITLRVWTDHGCTDKKMLEVPIEVLGSGKIQFPNAFVPDPNGPSGGVVKPGEEHKNTVFLPSVIEGVVKYHLQIFNRWGEYIFDSTDPNVGWDGYINGVLAPQDVYVYKCFVQYKNGVQQTLTGSVTLLR